MAASKVTATMGIIPMAVRIEPATDKESSGLRTVCIGDEQTPHGPIRVEQRMTCPTCGIYHSSTFGFDDRGKEVGDTLVLITAKDIEEAKGTPITGRPGNPLPEIKFHPREKVYRDTVASDSVQNVYPDRGSEKTYALLRDTLIATPDKVACMIWAPSKVNALWTLEVVDDRIVATKRAWPEYVRPTMAIPDVEVTPEERNMFLQFVEATTEDFDLLVYSDHAHLKVEELVNSRVGTAVPASSGADVSDLLSALQTNLDNLGVKPTRKTAAKKAPAKRAAAKKTTTRKKVA